MTSWAQPGFSIPGFRPYLTWGAVASRSPLRLAILSNPIPRCEV